MIRKALSKIGGKIPIYRELRDMRNYLNYAYHALNRIDEELKAIHWLGAMHWCEAELASNPRYADPRRLQRYAHQVNSQNGEDGIIHEIFRRVNSDSRIFAEVGVGDGTENNTAFLLAQGWKGFWIDGNDSFLRALSGRKDLPDGCLTPHVAHVDRENVAGIFAKLGVPAYLDLMSLDINQNTYYLWQALRDYSARVVVVEYNATIPPYVDWKVHYAADRAWDRTINFGASLKAYETLGRELGYSLVGCDFNGINAFFVRNDLIQDRFAAPFTAENHYEPPRNLYIHRRGHPHSILDR
jgi:hypothetical protein